MKPRVVLLAGSGSSTRIVYHGLTRDLDVRGVIIEDPPSRRGLLLRRVRRLGLPTVAGQVLFQVGVSPLLERASRSRRRDILQQHGLLDEPIPHRIRARVRSANDPQSVELIREWDPEAVILCGTRILEEDVLQGIGRPIFNLHSGITPLYRGSHGGYWALVEGRRDACGVTVHLVDPGIDTGRILAQQRVEPTAQDNFATYPLLQVAAGLPVLTRCVQDHLAGETLEAVPPQGPSRLWSHPTLVAYLRHRWLHGVR